MEIFGSLAAKFHMCSPASYCVPFGAEQVVFKGLSLAFSLKQLPACGLKVDQRLNQKSKTKVLLKTCFFRLAPLQNFFLQSCKEHFYEKKCSLQQSQMVLWALLWYKESLNSAWNVSNQQNLRGFFPKPHRVIIVFHQVSFLYETHQMDFWISLVPCDPNQIISVNPV